MLIWLLHTLIEDEKTLYFITLPTVIDELKHLIQSERSAKEMISSFVADIIADLSICAEVLRQLNIFQP